MLRVGFLQAINSSTSPDVTCSAHDDLAAVRKGDVADRGREIEDCLNPMFVHQVLRRRSVRRGRGRA
jgi:hypothetical protein